MSKTKIPVFPKEFIAIDDTEDRQSALEKSLKDIRKKYGQESVMKMGDVPTTNVKRLSTGILTLDLMTGGGWPKGRVIELYGPESSGKTTIALQSVAAAQREGGNVAYIDAENALDVTYAQSLGVDVDNLLLSQPDTGEQGLEIADQLVGSGAISLVVVDSVAALVPRAEIEGEMGDAHVGLQARLMSQALRKLAGTLNKTDTTIIFINQLREKVGVMFGNPEVTPGGRALKFYSSIRVEVRGGGQLKTPSKDKPEVYGRETKVKTTKNKVYPPFKEGKLQMLFGTGLSRTSDILENAVDRDLINKSGSWYSYDGERIGQGIKNAADWLSQHREIEDKLYQAVQADGYRPTKKD